MINKKSVLMTLNHNCGYFSSVGSGIAGNVGRIGEEAEFENRLLNNFLKMIRENKVQV